MGIPTAVVQRLESLSQSNGTHQNGKLPNEALPYGWLLDPLEALDRELGPFTVDSAEEFLDQEAVELYNGWLVPQEMTDIAERRVVGTIHSMLDLSARQMGFGQVIPDQHECLLDDGTVIKPDVSLVSYKRLGQEIVVRGKHQRQLLGGGPELVIESRSPSNWRKQEARKRQLYFAHNTLIVWDVDEENQVIYVFRREAPETPTKFGVEDEIDCEPLLPNWRRRVADIFAEKISARALAGEVADLWTQQGIEQGIEQRSKEIALSMLADGLKPLVIAKYTGISEDEIEKLQSS